jgi:hypothetical protein
MCRLFRLEDVWYEEKKLTCTANKDFSAIGGWLGALRVGFSDEGIRVYLAR